MRSTPIWIFTLWLVSCSLLPGDGLRLQVELEPASRGDELGALSCFFVNVTGDGIPAPTLPASKSCAAARSGSLSRAFTLAEMQEGIQLSTTSGTNRRVQIVGMLGGCNPLA